MTTLLIIIVLIQIVMYIMMLISLNWYKKKYAEYLTKTDEIQEEYRQYRALVISRLENITDLVK
jgi:hypothetical protein